MRQVGGGFGAYPAASQRLLTTLLALRARVHAPLFFSVHDRNACHRPQAVQGNIHEEPSMEVVEAQCTVRSPSTTSI